MNLKNYVVNYRGQVSEVDSFRQKIKQYSDYDELKRELEIMKVDRERMDLTPDY